MTHKRLLAFAIPGFLMIALPQVAQPKEKIIFNTGPEALRTNVVAGSLAQETKTPSTKYFKSSESISLQEVVSLRVYHGRVALFDKVAASGNRLVVTMEVEVVGSDISQILFAFEKNRDLKRYGIDLLIGEHEIHPKAARDSFPTDGNSGNSKEKMGDLVLLPRPESSKFFFTFPGKTKRGYLHLFFDVPPEFGTGAKRIRLRFSFMALSASMPSEECLFVVDLEK